MTSSCKNRCAILLLIVFTILLTIAGSFSDETIAVTAQDRQAQFEPDQATRARLQTIIKGILAAWDQADVVCLGEDHGSRNDSDLRIALIEDPDFIRKASAIIIEFGDTNHQDILDRLVLEGENIPHEQLRALWKDISATWESPIYEAFLRAVQKVNSKLPRAQRLRVIAGDNSNERNRGRYIREAVSREVLDKHLKTLAVYGSVHCENRGMGFPGELRDKYPGRIWSVSSFYNVDEGRRVFGLGNAPKLIPITGTEQAKLPGGRMFFLMGYNDPATLGDLFNAVIYYAVPDTKVPSDKR